MSKNEIDPLPLSRVFPLVLELETSFLLPDSCSSYPPNEHFHISNQVFRLGMEEESSEKNEARGACRAPSNHASGKLR